MLHVKKHFGTGDVCALFFLYDFKGALCCLSGTQRDVPSGLSERAVSSSVCVCVRKMGLVGLTDDTWMQSFMHGF